MTKLTKQQALREIAERLSDSEWHPDFFYDIAIWCVEAGEEVLGLDGEPIRIQDFPPAY